MSFKEEKLKSFIKRFADVAVFGSKVKEGRVLISDLLSKLHETCEIFSMGTKIYIYKNGSLLGLETFNIADNKLNSYTTRISATNYDRVIYETQELSIDNIEHFLNLEIPNSTKFTNWGLEPMDIYFKLVHSEYPFIYTYRVLKEESSIKNYEFIHKKEKIIEYKENDKVYLTVRLMEGCRYDYNFNRFRRQPHHNNDYKPIYMHGKNGKISSDYSTEKFFIINVDGIGTKLEEVPYLNNIKKMELVKKNGEVTSFTNDDNRHMYNYDVTPNSNPVVEIRIY